MASAELVAYFKTLIPEFANLTDEVISSNIDIYEDFVSFSYFGRFYEKALCYFVAHNMVLNNIVTNEGSESGYLVSGNIIREKEGDLERAYGDNQSISSDADSLLKKSYYGRIYLQIRDMLKPIGMTRICL